MHPLWRYLTLEGLSELAVEAIRSWLWAPLLTVVSAVIGFREDIPLFYLFVGVTLVFAAVSTGLLRFSEWRYRQEVKNKLTFDMVRLRKKLNNLGCVEWLKLGFQLHNSALFPIEVELESLYTNLDRKHPPKKDYPLRQILISAGRSTYFDDFAIEPFDPPRDGSVEGGMTFVVRYGRLGRLTHKLSKKFRIVVGFDSKGDAKVLDYSEVRV